MTSVELIKQLCRERGISIAKLERDCGFSNGYIRNMANGIFPSDKALKIATYLEIPVEKLINPDAPYTAIESPGTHQNKTLYPIIVELLKDATEADIEDLQMASDILQRLIAYKRMLTREDDES